MKMNFKPVCLGFAAVMLAAPVLHAEEATQNWALGFGLTVANDSLKKVTHNTLGFNLNASTDIHLASSNVTLRPGIGITVMPGKSGHDSFWYSDGVNAPELRESTSKTQLVNVQGSFDLVIPSGMSESVTFITGLSLNQWRYSGTVTSGDTHPYGLTGSKASDSVKLGLRVGVNYQFNKKWAADALLQMVEFGSNDTLVTNRNVNPTWLQFGMKYQF